MIEKHSRLALLLQMEAGCSFHRMVVVVVVHCRENGLPDKLLLGDLLSHLVENALELLPLVHKVQLLHAIFDLLRAQNFFGREETLLLQLQLQIAKARDEVRHEGRVHLEARRVGQPDTLSRRAPVIFERIVLLLRLVAAEVDQSVVRVQVVVLLHSLIFAALLNLDVEQIAIAWHLESVF